MPDFRKALADDRVYIVDGGYGTLLQQRGLPPGLSPEMFGLKSPEVVRGVHDDYIKAGAKVLTTNTFGGSRFKLDPGVNVRELNRKMVALAREAAGDQVFVAASIGPTGHFVEPLGDLTFRELVQAFMEQIAGCVEGGADLILGETHFDLAEAKAVAIAARQVCDLPVAVSMTFEKGRCLTGTSSLTFVDTMQNLGVDLIATNCSAGPEQILDAVKTMAPRLETPLYVAANAGLPELDADGNTVFRLQPEPFAKQSVKFLDHGAKFVGGCCGTGPDHIRALSGLCRGRTWQRPEPTERAELILTSRSISVPIGFDHPGVIIGERINPTGKKKLTEELQTGTLSEALTMAQEQIDMQAPVLDVNVGAPMVDETELLPELVKALVSRFQTPLCLDSSSAEAVEAALWSYPGSPLINSISGDPGRMEHLGPLCKLFGAPFILLPIQGKKLPYTPEERLAIIESLLDQALALGIPKRLILVDALALTMSSKPLAARHCMETIRQCRERWGLASVVGLSNVSFGLPARELLNSTSLAMCIPQGLSAFIANPGSARLRETLAGAEVLMGRDPQAERFIAGYSGWTPSEGSQGAAGGGTPAKAAQSADGVQASGQHSLFEAVIRGAKDSITEMVEVSLEKGLDPVEMVNDILIPAIMEVGEKYERKEYFLPQLILSAETMQTAFKRLKPLLEKRSSGADKNVIVMATVEGDIHDIGKNIVCLMLQNHGFEVVDLGKDVSAERIVDAAQEHHAKLVGLSALMTTTMVKMEDTVRMLRERELDVKVLIGGAVVTEAFCRSIGADGFSTDAVSAVKLAKKLVA